MKKKLTNIEVILVVGTIIKLLGLIYKILLTRILNPKKENLKKKMVLNK